MAAPESSQEKRVGIAEQATWGTIHPVASAYDELSIEKTNIKHKFKVRENPGAHGQRFRTVDDMSADADGVMPEIPLSGFARRAGLDLLFNAFCQKVTEVGPTPFDRTYEVETGAQKQPEFGNGEGFFLSACERMPSGSSYAIKDAVCQSLDLKIEQGGRLEYSANLIGRGAVADTYVPSGTWTRVPGQFFYFHALTATADLGSGQVATRIQSASFSLAQTVKGEGHDGSGNPEELYVGNYELGFDIKLLRDQAQTALWLSLAKAGTRIPFILEWGTTSADGNLKITAGLHVGEDAFETVNDDPMGLHLTGTLVSASDSTAPFTILNTTDEVRSW